ncbi:MAG: hypothetical protein OXU45_06180 [Candidatus Melainabacteria bacterium]|nr:hypothetical protein [Candidatus Melainabacteria bacterium]
MASTVPISLVHQETPVSKPVELVNAQDEEDSREAAGIQSLNLAQPQAIKTMGEIESEQKKTLQYMLVDARKIVHLVTSGVCAVTSFASQLLPESSGVRQSLEGTSSMLAKLAIGILSGISGAYDAFKDGKHLLGWSQIGDAITTMIAPTEEITNYRGLWVGAYNLLPALETIEGKSQYLGFGDNLRSTWSAFKKTARELISKPASLWDPSKSGMLGVVTGLFTSMCSALYMATGIKAFASARDMLGMGVETEKLKSVHYQAGRNQYIASGWTMLVGSAANMISKFAEGGNKAFWSYWNLAANAIGKLFYLDALQNNEPARRQVPVDFSEMVSKTMRQAFDWGKETRASLERAQPHAIQDTEIADRVVELKEEEARVRQEISSKRSSTSSSAGSRSYRFSPSRSVGRSSSKAATVKSKASVPKAKVSGTKRGKPAAVKQAPKSRTTKTTRPKSVVRASSAGMKPRSHGSVPSMRAKIKSD